MTTNSLIDLSSTGLAEHAVTRGKGQASNGAIVVETGAAPYSQDRFIVEEPSPPSPLIGVYQPANRTRGVRSSVDRVQVHVGDVRLSCRTCM